MADELTVRVYNVRFGDAILVTVPDRSTRTGKVTTRRILIDVGNAPKVAGTGEHRGEGGADEVFEAVVSSILDELGGEPLDLYVMTHEHLDHVQGLFYASTKLPQLDLAKHLKVNHVWLTASADPEYYTNGKHPEALKQKLAFEAMYARLALDLAARPAAEGTMLMEMLANNDPSKTTQCVEFLRTLNPKKTTYVYRGVKLRGTHPFQEAKLEVWAPEEDTAEYYGRFQPLDGAPVAPVAETSGARAVTKPVRKRRPPARDDPLPPKGVDVGAFRQLLEARRSGIAENLLAIDKAANNTSVVFSLEWRGWRLLFAGDAEVRSWQTMNREKVLKPVHLLKVSHHGSHNGTPAAELFDAILPEVALDDRERHAVISTWTNTYGGIPHTPTNKRLMERATLQSTLDHKDDLFYEVTFPG
jgi:beta-lactamase superfamily II metal-dependent hydrolase